MGTLLAELPLPPGVGLSPVPSTASLVCGAHRIFPEQADYQVEHVRAHQAGMAPLAGRHVV